MLKFLLTGLAVAIASTFIATDAADAARRRTKPAKVVQTNVDTYYYLGTQLNDRARPYFGSPVRGHEFFKDGSDRATQ
jgi:hypothetical protein